MMDLGSTGAIAAPGQARQDIFGFEETQDTSTPNILTTYGDTPYQSR